MWGGVHFIWFWFQWFWCRICIYGEKKIGSKAENAIVVVYLYVAQQKQVVSHAGIIVTLGQNYCRI